MQRSWRGWISVSVGLLAVDDRCLAFVGVILVMMVVVCSILVCCKTSVRRCATDNSGLQLTVDGRGSWVRSIVSVVYKRRRRLGNWYPFVRLQRGRYRRRMRGHSGRRGGCRWVRRRGKRERKTRTDGGGDQDRPRTSSLHTGAGTRSGRPSCKQTAGGRESLTRADFRPGL